MAYAITWLGNNAVLYCRLWNTLQVPELRLVNAEIDRLLLTTPSAVHLVFHITEIDYRLPSISAMRSPLETSGRDRIGYTLFVGGNAAVRFIGSVVASSLGLRVHATPDMAGAVAVLSGADPCLDPAVFDALKHAAHLAPDRLPTTRILHHQRENPAHARSE